MIGFIFATLKEAGPFLKYINARKINDKPFLQLRGGLDSAKNSFLVVICGIGKVSAAAATQYMICRYQMQRIINAGVCGTVNKNSTAFQKGMVLLVSQAVEGDHGVFGIRSSPICCSIDLFLDLPRGRLITNDLPVFEPKHKNEHKNKLPVSSGDLVDMEGAAVARIAALNQVPCTLIKGITDFAAENGRKDLHFNLPDVSKKIARVLIEGLWLKNY